MLNKTFSEGNKKESFVGIRHPELSCELTLPPTLEPTEGNGIKM